ncbi:4Fe-4S dicluster domain-containing protein [Streptomyces sp. SL13]|uniref:4Fe-4S dicluster domain-containing protein n=1 Tax=Streptantibioticus silvisoli TaxID=2705255 RepID=A0AA90KGY5_9ACTN|nr:4Fe-4S binding protein [Streptantibioticus silvisoli]MDI5966619.1 4Fe-4S dicluster domain-containing protein [Streptantibioticus silvisoli]MDI5970829.1 4Fe-4S dicluster domain-containing protein [Streptantibioticus silvisoli]
MTTATRADIGACQGCGACLLTCPERAIRPGPQSGRRLIVLDRCTGCGECVEICPVDAIRLITAGPPPRHREEMPS